MGSGEAKIVPELMHQKLARFDRSSPARAVDVDGHGVLLFFDVAKLTHAYGPIPVEIGGPATPGAACRREDSSRQTVTLMIRVTGRQVLYEVKKL